MFLIVSTICTNSKPLDYHPNRSVFTHEDRLKQTLETIQSIRRLTTDRIVHVECGNHKKVDMNLSPIRSLVDDFFDLSDNPDIMSCVNSPHKSWAELKMVEAGIEKLSDEGRVFKISGRYCLSENFDLKSFHSGDITAKVFVEHGPVRCCSVLYSMRDLATYKDFCSTATRRFQSRQHVSMEEMLYDWAREKTLSIRETLGCRGLVSVSGQEWRA